MPAHDPSGLSFLIAAKHAEIGNLVELTRTADLMQALSALVHELQRERGLTNLMIASGGRAFAPARQSQLQSTDAALVRAQAQLFRLDPEGASTPPAQGARLYARIAQALQAQAAVPALRQGVEACAIDARRATRAYVKVVAAWLDVVFESADVAADAEVSRMLASLFHLMQAREQAGQERAEGGALFAAGAIAPQDRPRLQDLIDAQERSLAGFVALASPAVAAALSAVQDDPAQRERGRLRRLLMEPTVHGVLNTALSQPWFDACTGCMEAMKTVEDRLVAALRGLCVAKCSVLEHVLVQSQARRLREMSAELDATRAALAERKLVERAKGLLMSRAGMDEEQAYRALRAQAMTQGRRLSEVAEDVLRRTN